MWNLIGNMVMPSNFMSWYATQYNRVSIKKILLSVFASLFSINAQAQPATSTKTTADVICAYAPSQSEVVKGLSGAAGGALVTTAAVTQVTGWTVVAHSSGTMIFTGSSGYVGGTLGVAMLVPVIVGVGIVVAATTGTVELICAPKNHPEFTAKELRNNNLNN
jgi:hypothetical protein